ncbi:MAG TPA: tRNA pseudouridine(55) synthase TruB [Chitinophagales bacterium]|nr:tRNA pseudouridine(55) synthase TruB [Chitinophagales bacterium]
MNFIEGEVLLINKPLTWTSFDVVNKLRYALTKKIGYRIKVGHAGTLDPLATGLLIICTGKMTKRIDEYQGMDKEYTGTFLLGATTPTYDSEMEPDALFPTEHITESLLVGAVTQLSGIQQQMPPVYSAIKIDGKTAYQQARKGKEMEMKTRTVEIKEFELTSIEMPEVDFRAVCSKGTYIRSLAYDFGKAVDSGAYLKALCRTKIGQFDLKNSLTVEECLKVIADTEIIYPDKTN